MDRLALPSTFHLFQPSTFFHHLMTYVRTRLAAAAALRSWGGKQSSSSSSSSTAHFYIPGPPQSSFIVAYLRLLARLDSLQVNIQQRLLDVREKALLSFRRYTQYIVYACAKRHV